MILDSEWQKQQISTIKRLFFFRFSRIRPDGVYLLQPNAAQDGLATPLTPSLSFLIVAPLALPPLSFPVTPSFFFPSLPLLVLLCDLLRGAGRQRRNLPVWNDLSSQHYHPNTPPSTLCYKGLGKLLFLWDMIKEMLPYVHIFYGPTLEQDMPWFTRLETAAVCLASVTWLNGGHNEREYRCEIVKCLGSLAQSIPSIFKRR